MTDNAAPQQGPTAGARDVHEPTIPGNGEVPDVKLAWLRACCAADIRLLPCWEVVPGTPVCACPKGATCGPDTGKHPRIADWRNAASGDIARVEGWHRQWPTANWAWALDEHFVIDVDPRNGAPKPEEFTGWWVNAYDFDLPTTLTQSTGGGGLHLVFRQPDGPGVRNGKLAKGIDVKGSGGYILICPSNHRSGGFYGWLNWGQPVAAAPDELMPLLPKVGTHGGNGAAGKYADTNLPTPDRFDPEAWLAGAPAVGCGEQREYLLRGLGSMRARGFRRLEMRMLGWVVAQQFTTCDSTNPWTENYVYEVVDDVHGRYPPGTSDGVTEEELRFAQEFIDRMRAATNGAPTPVEAGADPQEDAPPQESPQVPPVDAQAQAQAEALAEVEGRVAVAQLKLWVTREAARRLDAAEVAAARGPRPKRTARAYAEVAQPDTVLDEVLAAEVNLLGGPSEAGKSLLARDWALAVATKESWWDHAVPERRDVLWVASEGLHDFRERWMEQPGWEKAADRIYVLEEPVDLVHGDDADWLLREYTPDPAAVTAAKKAGGPIPRPPGLVIFDVIYGMGLPDDNGTKDVVPLITALKRISAAWGAATLAVGHPGHNGERRFRGSSAWRQLAATEWHLADGALSCEKSKIADKRKVGGSVTVAYPNLTRANLGDVAKVAAERDRLIRADVESHPRDSNSARARRLYGALGVSERTARRLVATLLGVEEAGS
jgi:Bifunctional DNA primase/polymerase, N-terminal/AAA domain